MNIAELLTNLNHQGVELWVDNDKLKINSPKGVLTQPLKSDIATHKNEIIAFLCNSQDSNGDTDTGLSLQTIGRLIGGYCPQLSAEFKSPIIKPQLMAKQLKITFRPLPKGFNNKEILQFRAE